MTKFKRMTIITPIKSGGRSRSCNVKEWDNNCEASDFENKCARCYHLDRMLWRLAEYEDTGLDPEQVQQMASDVVESVKKYGDLNISNLIAEQLQEYRDTGLTPEEVAGLARAKRVDCDGCKFRASDSWKYYTFPCRECRHRTKDWYEAAEAALAERRDG